ncbi:hypothetical protein Tco_0487539 [Tanacetum coccineum]
MVLLTTNKGWLFSDLATQKGAVWLWVHGTEEGVGWLAATTTMVRLAVTTNKRIGIGVFGWANSAYGAFGLAKQQGVLGGDTGNGSIYSLNHCPGVLGGDTCDGGVKVEEGRVLSMGTVDEVESDRGGGIVLVGKGLGNMVIFDEKKLGSS